MDRVIITTLSQRRGARADAGLAAQLLLDGMALVFLLHLTLHAVRVAVRQVGQCMYSVACHMAYFVRSKRSARHAGMQQAYLTSECRCWSQGGLR